MKLGWAGWAVAAVAALGALTAQAGEVRVEQVRYQGNDGGPAPRADQYRNPVIAGFHPDPSVLRVGDDFYLVNSSFGYFPGLPVFHSRNLVDWTQIGNAIDRPGQVDFGPHELTRGLFAASISWHDGIFYIVNTCFYCDRGNFLITAKDPAGPWSDPVWLGFEGIDPSLFFDEDGRAWLVNNGLPESGKLRYDGHRAIWLQEFDVASMKRVGPRRVLVDAGAEPANNPEHVEGPHLFRRGDWYYLTAAEGGTGEQHAQMVYRSREVTGPYQPWSGNPTLTQRDLDPSRTEPITSAGHAQFVALKDGSWWAVFLATRPYRGNHYNLGRETFLLPVRWQDDWPQVLPHGERVPAVAQRPALPRARVALPASGPMRWREDFHGKTLPLSWLTINAPRQPWFNTGRDGLRITASATPLSDYASGQPAYVAHRLQHHHADIETTLDLRKLDDGEQAGLALFQNESHFYAVGVARTASGDRLLLQRRSDARQPALGEALAEIPLPARTATVSLRLRVAADRLAVDYALAPGAWKPLSVDLDASVLSTQSAGGFIGVTFGPYAWRMTSR